MSIRRVSARVFGIGSGTGGGNPVTVFWCRDRGITEEQGQRLARSCEWESVVIEPSNRFSFYMPSGEQVSFCAHAAMGAARVVAAGSGDSSTAGATNGDGNTSLRKSSVVQFITSELVRQQARVDISTGKVWLEMESSYQETAIPTGDDANGRAFRELLAQCQVDWENLPSSPPFPVNASVARPKTLVELDSVEAVHAAVAPTNAYLFRELCDTLGSTGLYFYAWKPKQDDANEKSSGGLVDMSNHMLEARQFPRASGYPEDPATGIAAGALAVHLAKKRPQVSPSTAASSRYSVFQGTAMGRPSLIEIDRMTTVNGLVSFACGGLVEVDDEAEESV